MYAVSSVFSRTGLDKAAGSYLEDILCYVTE